MELRSTFWEPQTCTGPRGTDISIRAWRIIWDLTSAEDSTNARCFTGGSYDKRASTVILACIAVRGRHWAEAGLGAEAEPVVEDEFVGGEIAEGVAPGIGKSASGLCGHDRCQYPSSRQLEQGCTFMRASRSGFAGCFIFNYVCVCVFSPNYFWVFFLINFVYVS